MYGNWVLDDAEGSLGSVGKREQIKLDWKDFVALSIASLETFLLPIVVFAGVVLILAILFTHA